MLKQLLQGNEPLFHGHETFGSQTYAKTDVYQRFMGKCPIAQRLGKNVTSASDSAFTQLKAMIGEHKAPSAKNKPGLCPLRNDELFNQVKQMLSESNKIVKSQKCPFRPQAEQLSSGKCPFAHH